jgi:L-ascorbate metabolism protein UlaG (beta-lactamase superfamily)
MRITMIGHSTVLINIEGKRILTDPYFGTFGNLAYKRVAPPSCCREELRDVDLVLQSHSHFDHVDRAFLRSLPPETPILAPQAMFFPFSGAHGNLMRIQRWQSYELGSVKVTPVPAVHIAITNGFIIQGEGLCVYFAADTHFNPFMKTVREKFSIDVALMPVTTFRIPMTMGEQDAVRAAAVLEPKVVIPIHLGIQPRSPLMRTSQSPESFAKLLADAGSKTKVVILKEGMSWES